MSGFAHVLLIFCALIPKVDWSKSRKLALVKVRLDRLRITGVERYHQMQPCFQIRAAVPAEDTLIAHHFATGI
jgi:hypothetical protein